MNIVSRFFLTVCFLFFHAELFCQYEDAGLWTSLNIEKQLNERTSLQFNNFLRFNENYSELGTWGTEFGLNKAITRKVKYSLMYRAMGRKQLDNSYSIRHRFFADLSRQSTWLGITFQARLRGQFQFRDVNSSPNGWSSAEKYLRTLFFASKRVNYHWSFFTMAEIFSPVLVSGRTSISPDRTMSYAGLNYRFNKYSELVLYYLLNRPAYGVNPKTEHISGIRFDITL